MPRVTVLQLDTDFPRVAGDVGAVQTYTTPPQIIRIGGAGVAQIVTERPQDIDITPFERALAQATGDVIVTSCGFLSYWQDHLAALCDRPFISSALTTMDRLHRMYTPDQIAIITFDAARLNAAHLGAHKAYADSIIGLPPTCHLRDVIENNKGHLDLCHARAEMRSFAEQNLRPTHRHIVLECTNLPPYREIFKDVSGLPVTDILTCVETTTTGTVARRFGL